MAANKPMTRKWLFIFYDVVSTICLLRLLSIEMKAGRSATRTWSPITRHVGGAKIIETGMGMARTKMRQKASLKNPI
jgi:hypothetical protein